MVRNLTLLSLLKIALSFHLSQNFFLVQNTAWMFTVIQVIVLSSKYIYIPQIHLLYKNILYYVIYMHEHKYLQT